MERITPSDPFGSKEDPFGDSFISYPVSVLLTIVNVYFPVYLSIQDVLLKFPDLLTAEL